MNPFKKAWKYTKKGARATYNGGKKVVQGTGRVVKGTTKVVRKGSDKVYDAANSAAGYVAGKPGRRVMETVTSVTRAGTNLPLAVADGAGSFLQTGDVRHFNPVAMAIASIIRSSHAQYAPYGMPIPGHIASRLSAHFPPQVLQQARYVVDRYFVQFTWPALINGGNALFGRDHAVTLYNIIVFSVDPGNNLRWWAHELHHVAQYLNWGVDGFAARYAVGWWQVEGEAENVAAYV